MPSASTPACRAAPAPTSFAASSAPTPSGAATFTTIYPGWYQGRAVHIHFKIRTDPDAEAGFEFTSQLFFDDALSQQVYASGVYASKGSPGPAQRERRDLQPERRGDAPGRDPGRRRVQDDVRDRGPARLARSARPLPVAATRQIREPAMTAPISAPIVRPRRNFAVRSSGRSCCAAPRTGPARATTDTSPMPTHATIDAPSRW